MEYYNTDTIRLQYEQGLYLIILFERTDSLAFRLQYSKRLLTSAPASIVPIGVLADSLSIEDIIGSIKFY